MAPDGDFDSYASPAKFGIVLWDKIYQRVAISNHIDFLRIYSPV